MNAHLDEMLFEAHNRGTTVKQVQREFEGDLDMITAAEHQRYEDDMAELDAMREDEVWRIVGAIEDGVDSYWDVFDHISEGKTDAVGPLVQAMGALIRAKTDAEQFHASTLVRHALMEAAYDYANEVAEDTSFDQLIEKKRGEI